MKVLIERIDKAFNLTSDLVTSLSEQELKLKIPNVPSNTIGEQLWCIIGARQSYMNAIRNEGEWQGFNCGLSDAHSKSEILALLQETATDLNSLSTDDSNERIIIRLLELLEHEVQHHGQLIRFIYSNKLKFPLSWNERYTV